MRIHGKVVKELRQRTIGTFQTYEAHTAYPKDHESFPQMTKRLLIACFACGVKPGTHFGNTGEWLCDLHDDAPTGV